jgi:hypothetical protein
MYMSQPTPWFKRISRTTLENIGLLLFCAILFCFRLNTVPEKLELFEEWVNNYLPILAKPWSEMYRDFAQVGHNDTICAINAPIWLVLVQGSIDFFGKIPFAYRLPSVLLTIWTPVITAELVRRYFRKDLALLTGLAVATHQHILWFGRTGGYVGPTLTLLMASLLFASMIIFEKNRRAWIWLALSLAILPFFYSTIRYYIAVPLGMIAYQFVVSSDFRRRNAIPMVAAVIFLLISFIPLTQHGIKQALYFFVSGRGEQVLLTESTLEKGFESDAIPAKYRLSGIVQELVPERLKDLVTIYDRGNRFFSSRHQQLHYDSVWTPLRPWILLGTALGFVYCIWKSFTLKRWLLPVAWSVWAWIPLLVTTGISPNRLFLGIPADVMLLVFGVFAPADVAAKCGSLGLARLLKLTAWLLILSLGCYSAAIYYIDYSIAPHL